MFTPISVEKQYEHAGRDDLRILIVGAGIAGVTAAQLLRRGGRHPVLVERGDSKSAPGYMLALMPMVDAALDDLGVRDRYRAHSVSLERYAVHGHTGRLLRVDSMASIMARYGDYRGISRGALLEVLTADGCAVAFETTVTDLSEDRGVAAVGLTGVPRPLDFDLVIVADGIHSTTREFVLGGRQLEVVDTNWGGWVVWAPADSEPDLGEELWGAGNFAGMYPVAGELGVFLGGPRADTKAGPASFAEQVRRGLDEVNPRLDRALTAVCDDPDPYYWSLTDCRSPVWTTGHTVLLGDAAAGFLPTAGIGAGMAMESAWVLSRMLAHADRARLATVLHAYERAQRPRVEAAQTNSRQLAGMMFRRSRLLAVARELAMRVISVERALRPIQRLLQEQPDPREAIGTVQR